VSAASWSSDREHGPRAVAPPDDVEQVVERRLIGFGGGGFTAQALQLPLPLSCRAPSSVLRPTWAVPAWAVSPLIVTR